MTYTYIDQHTPNISHPAVVACIGYFDGMHIGHQELLKKTVELARLYNVQAGLITFEPDPWVPLYNIPKDRLEHITTMEQRLHIAHVFGIEQMFILRFTKDMSQLPADAFVQNVLAKISLKGLVCGFDFHYGAGGKGNVDTLRKSLPCPVAVIEEVQYQGQKISSTRIVSLIKEGDVAAAAQMMNRPFAICGKVIHGEHNGTAMGMPTANVAVDAEYVKPLTGVYAGYAIVQGIAYPAMINYGHNPTVHYLQNESLEAHIIGLDKDLYAQEITVQFVRFLRHEKQFSSIAELKKQLSQDRRMILKILEEE